MSLVGRAFVCLLAHQSLADRPDDIVTSLPDFDSDSSSWGFTVYSGLLEVPGPINGYDSLSIHYQFHTSQEDVAGRPVVAWHNGGPLSSSVSIGTYNEMGAFVVGYEGNYINPYAWNRAANMLYLESPAGSGYEDWSTGYSSCMQGGQVVSCEWDDVTQGEAYAHTLKAFFSDFPEFAENDLYLVGESYAGQYIPNIAHFIVNHKNDVASGLNLKGIAVGNGCGLGTETLVACVGPSEDRIHVHNYFGKGLFSPKLKKQIDDTCEWPTGYTNRADTFGHSLSPECKSLLQEMNREVGPHDVYNIYDNCPNYDDFFRRTGKDRRWLHSYLRDNQHNVRKARAELKEMNGGYTWDCMMDMDDWITRQDVRKALHLEGAQGSKAHYNQSGPASVVLYPELAKQLRVLIYAGDADGCVPYNGNEALVEVLEEQGAISETQPWTPWFANNSATPTGYITAYAPPGSTGSSFFFQTVRMAGHMVPQYAPEAGLAVLSHFLAGEQDSVEGHSTFV